MVIIVANVYQTYNLPMQLLVSISDGNNSPGSTYVDISNCNSGEEVESEVAKNVRIYAISNWSTVFNPGDKILVLGANGRLF